MTRTVSSLARSGNLGQFWRMKKLSGIWGWFVAGVILVGGASAEAHLKLGTYRGFEPNSGAPCALNVSAIRFEGGIRHPLNERVDITVEGRSWTLVHPARIDASSGKVLFSGATLEAAQGISGGAEAAVLTMSHEEGKEGPQELILLQHDYRDESRSLKRVCSGLVFEG
jgi:hypothetical protein